MLRVVGALMRQGHTSPPCTAAICSAAEVPAARLQVFAVEFPPEVSGSAADLPQQGVCLQLAVDAAFSPDNTGILAQEHMCLLRVP